MISRWYLCHSMHNISVAMPCFDHIISLWELSALHGDDLAGTLHSLCTTRWASRADNCAVLEKSLPVVATTLKQIKNGGSFDRETASHAAALLKALDFEFCVCLSILGELLELCNTSSKYLQAEDMAIS